MPEVTKTECEQWRGWAWLRVRRVHSGRSTVLHSRVRGRRAGAEGETTRQGGTGRTHTDADTAAQCPLRRIAFPQSNSSRNPPPRKSPASVASHPHSAASSSSLAHCSPLPHCCVRAGRSSIGAAAAAAGRRGQRRRGRERPHRARPTTPPDPHPARARTAIHRAKRSEAKRSEANATRRAAKRGSPAH